MQEKHWDTPELDTARTGRHIDTRTFLKEGVLRLFSTLSSGKSWRGSVIRYRWSVPVRYPLEMESNRCRTSVIAPHIGAGDGGAGGEIEFHVERGCFFGIAGETANTIKEKSLEATRTINFQTTVATSKKLKGAEIVTGTETSNKFGMRYTLAPTDQLNQAFAVDPDNVLIDLWGTPTYPAAANSSARIAVIKWSI
ncbi:hypothetical protein PROFUN_08131 [Planoprotostelium fungivorum]|uniref:Uncharacterized protein n=1 Tax=Planoprotostelium fungivorum TaxID=1890364 RepID=A0A2P6MQF4_9EUKA|nr:hypothetical protein PROFUN_08131 [Planoprotostelium fungivorum]